jgi:hypothetical protein
MRRCMMFEAEPVNDPKGWKIFLRNHWKLFLVMIGVAVVAFIWSILVYLWFVGQAQLTGMVPTTLGLWSMGHLVTFLLNLLFWMVLLVGLPLIVVGVVGWLWWRRLPLEERAKYRFFRNRSRRSDGGNAISFLVFIAFLIKVYVDGNWNVAFGTWTFDYLVYSMLTAFIWVIVIMAIPAAIGLIWWLSRRGR